MLKSTKNHIYKLLTDKKMSRNSVANFFNVTVAEVDQIVKEEEEPRIMSTYEINKELVLSTAHVTDEECNHNILTNYSTDEYNVRFHVTNALDEIAAQGVNGLYPNLVKLLELARRYECKWLLLDAEAEIHIHLKQFDW